MAIISITVPIYSGWVVEFATDSQTKVTEIRRYKKELGRPVRIGEHVPVDALLRFAITYMAPQIGEIMTEQLEKCFKMQSRAKVRTTVKEKS